MRVVTLETLGEAGGQVRFVMTAGVTPVAQVGTMDSAGCTRSVKTLDDRGPAADAVEDLTAESQTGMEPTSGSLLCQTLELTARYCLSADHRSSVFTSRIETCRI